MLDCIGVKKVGFSGFSRASDPQALGISGELVEAAATESVFVALGIQWPLF